MTLFFTNQKQEILIDLSLIVTTYNPSLPNLNNVIKKYYPILTATEHCQEAFKDTLLLAYRCPKNLRDFLVKAKLRQSPPNNTNLPKKVTCCNDGHCHTCKFIGHGTSSYTFHNTGEQRKILQNLSCSSNNLVYLINCKHCIKKDPTLPCQYTGQTCHTLRERFGEHRLVIENNIDESIPIHFNQPKHTLNDIQVIPLLHVNSNRDSICFSMEQRLIDKAATLQNGINQTCDH